MVFIVRSALLLCGTLRRQAWQAWSECPMHSSQDMSRAARTKIEGPTSLCFSILLLLRHSSRARAKTEADLIELAEEDLAEEDEDE